MFGDLATVDIVLAVLTGVCGSVVLAAAYRMANSGVPNWKSRKLVHVTVGTLIGLTVMGYTNLSGPALAIVLFLVVLLYAWAHKSDLVFDLLVAGSREGESRLNTFASGLMGVVAFGAVFVLFFSRPEIFVASILAVAWGDAAGEVIGRPYGGRFIRKRFRKKSFEGALAVFVFTLLGIVSALAVYSTEVSPLASLPQIALIGLVVALIEVLSIGWTDNFFIPLVTAGLMWQLLFPGMPLLLFSG